MDCGRPGHGAGDAPRAHLGGERQRRGRSGAAGGGERPGGGAQLGGSGPLAPRQPIPQLPRPPPRPPANQRPPGRPAPASHPQPAPRPSPAAVCPSVRICLALPFLSAPLSLFLSSPWLGSVFWTRAHLLGALCLSFPPRTSLSGCLGVCVSRSPLTPWGSRALGGHLPTSVSLSVWGSPSLSGTLCLSPRLSFVLPSLSLSLPSACCFLGISFPLRLCLPMARSLSSFSVPFLCACLLPTLLTTGPPSSLPVPPTP